MNDISIPGVFPHSFNETPSPELLLHCLKEANRPLSLDEMLKISHLPRRAKRKTKAMMTALEASGDIVGSKGKWFLPRKRLTITGIFSLQRSGIGFVTPEKVKGNDVYIAPYNIGDAWDSDEVEVLILPGRNGPRREGKITAILRAAHKEIPLRATKLQAPNEWLCTPLHHGIQSLFLITATIHVEPNDLLLAKPLKKISNTLWTAQLTANLHNENTPNAQELLTKANHAIPSHFPPLVLEQSEKLPNNPTEADFINRKDLRHLSFVTIDGPDAKDFDDAIYVEKQPAGFRLYVAIADVAHYIAHGSPIDREASTRGNSYYFPLSVEPMLPEILSNNLCSLRPNVPRLTMIAELTFTHQGKETSAEFYPAVIESKARLTYDQVRDAAITGDTQAIESLLPVFPMLEQALTLAKALSAMRKQRGNLAFELPEPGFAFDAQGNLTHIYPREQHFAHKLIEEFMVAANEAVARYLTTQNVPFLYRVHPAPDPEKIKTLVRFLEQFSLIAFNNKSSNPGQKKKPYTPNPIELAAVLEAAKDTPQEYTISRMTLRSMMQAKYSQEFDGHYGLASDCYCHFTSPIRRYADLTVHRALKNVLSHSQKEQKNGSAALSSLADHINQTERTALEAEREIQKRLTCLFLTDKIGEKYDGIISGVTDFGIFVETPSSMAEGMIRLGALEDDYYEYFPERHLLRGRHSGKTFSLGQKVQVVLTDVNIARLEINFSLITTNLPRTAPVKVLKTLNHTKKRKEDSKENIRKKPIKNKEKQRKSKRISK